jgi:ferredoxin
VRRPVVDIGTCTLCMGCVEVAARIFRMNHAAGYIEVIELDYYPPHDVDEAIKYCPEDAIAWEEN